jgi:hypothetical protein
VKVEEWSATYTSEVEAWHYEPPWNFYDLASDPADAAAAWNERGIRLYERLGFREVARETRRFELVGKHEFVQMESPA